MHSALLSLLLVGLQPAPPAEEALRQDFAATQRIARDAGEALWPGYGAAPFGALLLLPDRELLICREPAPEGFTAAGQDAATGCASFTRPRSALPAGILAAMPMFGLPSTIVMGTPAGTGQTPARWRTTILHEHFHQWQTGLPDYYPRVAALDLAGDDRTGVWMLNFAFPYAQADVAAAQAAASRALAEALGARGTARFRPLLRRYLTRRAAFAAAAGERSWRYFEFQLWQEGVARWTEIAIARRSGDAAMQADADARERGLLDELAAPDLASRQRISAYAVGAGEAMLLEACGPQWRTRYPALLALGPLLDDARRRCG